MKDLGISCIFEVNLYIWMEKSLLLCLRKSIWVFEIFAGVKLLKKHNSVTLFGLKISTLAYIHIPLVVVSNSKI